jgi:hypothetical protein
VRLSQRLTRSRMKDLPVPAGPVKKQLLPCCTLLKMRSWFSVSPSIRSLSSLFSRSSALRFARPISADEGCTQDRCDVTLRFASRLVCRLQGTLRTSC